MIFFIVICYILIFCGHLVYFVVIWYILWSFGIFCGHLVYFPRFGRLYREKSGNTVVDTWLQKQFETITASSCLHCMRNRLVFKIWFLQHFKLMRRSATFCRPFKFFLQKMFTLSLFELNPPTTTKKTAETIANGSKCVFHQTKVETTRCQNRQAFPLSDI
jgi:hypothetical protein